MQLANQPREPGPRIGSANRVRKSGPRGRAVTSLVARLVEYAWGNRVGVGLALIDNPDTGVQWGRMTQ